MAKRLRARLDEERPAPASVEVAEVGAEHLPFDDASFDTVVSTLVFCTVTNPKAAAAEAHRVLKPGGKLLFLEHVRDDEGTRRARWQDRIERPWGWIAGGCHPNRDTGPLLSATFTDLTADRTDFPGSGTAMVKPLIRGSALR